MKTVLKVALGVLLVLTIGGIAARRGTAAPASEAGTLTGMFATTWGDSAQGEGLPPQFHLYDAQGKAYLLNLDESLVAGAGGSTILDGTQVTVAGVFDPGALDQTGNPSFAVNSITPAEGASALASVTGPQPWVVLLCKFADSGYVPKSRSFFQGLFGATFPGIGDFWSRVSYGAVNLSGTAVTPAWMTLPRPRSYYIGSSANLQALTNDCTGVADATINFSQFSGIAMMFNGELDGYAWGGMTAINRDGVGGIRAAWMPPWGFENQNVLAHEVGHGFGLPHSSGPYNQTYDSPWDVMSSWPPCGAHHDPRYGCIGVETIAYHRNLLGWMPSDRIFTASRGTNQDIKIERLGQPTNPSGSYLMAIVPVPGSSTRYYTVETRRRIDGVEYNDYEEDLIGQAVVIHLVDTSRGDRTAQVVDSDGDGNVKDAGSMWTVGETFRNTNADISIGVLSSTSTGYWVRIRNGSIANDNFGTAKTINAYPYSASLDARNATTGNSDPVFVCAGTKGVASLWYKFTPAMRGKLQISTVGSDYDTLLAVWTGFSGNLTSKACNDDSGGSGASVLSRVLIPATTYYIEVAGKSGAGYLNLNLDFTPCYSLAAGLSPTDTGAVGLSRRPNCGGNFYTKGSSVQVIAYPASGMVFSSWSGSLTGSANPSSALIMDTSRSVTARFLPAAPVLISPEQGNIVDTLQPTLDWSDVPGATYSIQYSRFSNFSSTTSLSATGSSLTVPSLLTGNATYYWRVRSKASGVQSAWSTSSFRTANPPSTPTLLSPGNGDLSTSAQPTLDWSGSANYPAGYQVQVSASNAFATALVDVAVTDNTYTLPSALANGATYYWRVRAFNAASQHSNWSAVFSFTTPP